MPSAIVSTAKDDEKSCDGVLRQWMNDRKARQPVTWNTLIQALQDAHHDLNYLVNEVKLALDEGIVQ